MSGVRVAQHRKPSSGFTDPSFARIGELAHLFAGLVFPANRQPSAEAGMRRAMSVLRIGEPGALLRAIETPGDARNAVLAELTVGESYFFRDAAQLDILTTEILPARVETCGPARPLRLWSAGCASGEEPYTLAIMLREQRWPHPARILGTDIARPRLSAARRGRYTRWALRGVSDERIARWFSRSGSYYDLEAGVRAPVEFRELNLVVDDYASAERGPDGYDLVLCRNVMIYFDLPTVARIATGLLASLAPDGWLVLGASDPPLAHLVECEVVVTPAGVAYRRADRTGGATRLHAPLARLELAPHPDPASESVHWLERLDAAPLRSAPSPADSATQSLWDFQDTSAAGLRSDGIATPGVEVGDELSGPVAAPERSSITPNDEVLATYARADYPAAERLAAAALVGATDADALRIWITYVRAVANQGRLNEAGELCTRALDLFPLATELHYLHATLLGEAGWFGDVAAAARRAIYLDRRFVMGHLLLGDALARTSDIPGARLAFENVVHLLANVDAASPVLAADGVPAGRLRQVAELRLRSLTAGGRA